MTRWSVWQIGRGGAPERVGSYTSGPDARRVLRASILRGAAVDPDGEVSEARGIAPRDVAAIEAAAEAWLATVPTMPAPPAVIEIPAPEQPVVGIGAATEAPLPVVVEPPVVEPCEDAPHPLGCVEKEFTIQPTAEVERLRIALADATASAVAAEERVADLERQLARTDLALAARDRTIANLRTELAEAHAHPVVRITAPVRRRAQRAPETAVQTLWRRLAERAEGRR